MHGDSSQYIGGLAYSEASFHNVVIANVLMFLLFGLPIQPPVLRWYAQGRAREIGAVWSNSFYGSTA